MRIPLSEIWNFIELIGDDEKGWDYRLIAGKTSIGGLKQHDLVRLKSDLQYDTELLPTLFTYREILWQPDVFTEKDQSMPPLRILKAFCEETIGTSFQEQSPEYSKVYRDLLQGMIHNCEETLERLKSLKTKDHVPGVLGDFRTHSFPILKFFIYHPQNRIDYYRDAVNRLNYAVKVMLTEYHGKYTELQDPYWEVIYSKSSSKDEKQSP